MCNRTAHMPKPGMANGRLGLAEVHKLFLSNASRNNKLRNKPAENIRYLGLLSSRAKISRS